MKNERILISIPYSHYSQSMVDFFQTISFEVSSAGCGTVEFMGYGDIRNIKKVLREQYGKMLINNIHISYTKDLGFDENEGVDEEILYERKWGT